MHEISLPRPQRAASRPQLVEENDRMQRLMTFLALATLLSVCGVETYENRLKAANGRTIT